jgi:hypothetical protein
VRALRKYSLSEWSVHPDAQFTDELSGLYSNAMKYPSKILGLICLALLLSSSAGALVIDDFASGPLLLQTTNYPGLPIVQTGLPTFSVIGGSRFVRASAVFGGIATAEINTNSGTFNFSTDANSSGYFTLTYGGVLSPLGNLTSGGNDRFQIAIAEMTSGLLYRGLFDFSVDTRSGWKTYHFEQDISKLTSPGNITIPFANFVGADMTQVIAIQIDAGRTPRSSLIAFDSIITTIPEPSALIVFTVGISLLVRRSICF